MKHFRKKKSITMYRAFFEPMFKINRFIEVLFLNNIFVDMNIIKSLITKVFLTVILILFQAHE